MSAFIGMVNNTALVLGYIVLALWIMFVIWVANVLTREVRYDLKKKRHDEKEWDNIRSRWILDMPNDERYTVDHDTDIIGFTVDDIYDYHKEFGNDHA